MFLRLPGNFWFGDRATQNGLYTKQLSCIYIYIYIYICLLALCWQNCINNLIIFCKINCEGSIWRPCHCIIIFKGSYNSLGPCVSSAMNNTTSRNTTSQVDMMLSSFNRELHRGRIRLQRFCICCTDFQIRGIGIIRMYSLLFIHVIISIGLVWLVNGLVSKFV